MELIGRSETETVTTRRVDIKGTLIAGISHGGIIGDAIGHRRDGTIVICHEDDGRWRQMTTHGILIRKTAHQFFIVLIFSQESIDRTTMGFTLIHRDDRIEKNTEVRTGVKLTMR